MYVHIRLIIVLFTYRPERWIYHHQCQEAEGRENELYKYIDLYNYSIPENKYNIVLCA